MRVATLESILSKPERLKRLNQKELLDFCSTIERIINFTDYQIVTDLIRDRNEFRDCYNKLRRQIQDLGLEPCIDYYSYKKKGHK